MSPPFLKRLPLAEEITRGFTALCVNIVGKANFSVLGLASTNPATVPVRMKSRRLIFLLIGGLQVQSFGRIHQAYTSKQNSRQTFSTSCSHSDRGSGRQPMTG